MQMKAMLLKEKTMKDMVQHNVDIGELQRVISHNDQLKNFMSIKNQERTSQGENQDHPRKQGMMKLILERHLRQITKQFPKDKHTVNELVGYRWADGLSH